MSRSLDKKAIQLPYWFHGTDTFPFPGHDFNIEILPPGDNKTFPDGVVGIRVDDDFWAVAALPYEYRDIPIEELVKALWPEIEAPTFGPDSK